jgi:hypothetical protein
MNCGVPAPYYMYHTRHSHPAQRTTSHDWRRFSGFAPRVRGVSLRAAVLTLGFHGLRRPSWGNLARLRARKEAGVPALVVKTPALIEAIWLANTVNCGPVIYVS